MNRLMKSAAPVLAGNGHVAPDRKTFLCGLPAATLPHLEKSLKKRWKSYRKELWRCQSKFSAKAIHDSRVESRRLLSTVELLGGFLPAGRIKKVERALKRQLDSFDELRDTQVQLPIVGKMLERFPGARPFHAYLVRREARFAKHARKSIQAVNTSRLGKLIGACREDVQKKRKVCSPTKCADLLVRAVGRAFARTAQLRARIDPRDTRTIHRTRVAFKRFRYMVEALAGCLPAIDDRFLAALRDYQTLMGDLQDIEVLRKTLDKFVERKAVGSMTARRLHEELLRRRQWLIRAYLKEANKLEMFWPPPGARAISVQASRPDKASAAFSHKAN